MLSSELKKAVWYRVTLLLLLLLFLTLKDVTSSNLTTLFLGYNYTAVASIVEGAALAAAFGELFDAVIGVKDKTAMFRLLLGDLDSTLYSLKPFIAKTVEYTNVDCPYIEELENVKMQMEEGEKLVRKWSKVRL